MSKTFKTGLIFFISSALFVCVRIFAPFVTGLSDNSSDLLFTVLIQIVCYGLIPTILYVLLVGKGKPKERIAELGGDLKLTAPLNPRYLGIGLGVGIMVYFLNTPIIIAWSKLLELLGYTFVSSVGTIYDSYGVLIMQIFLTAMLPAFFEEYSQRGILGLAFNNVKRDSAKILLMALMFALMHQNIVQTLYTFFGGVVISFMFVKTKSIWPGIIVHFTNNFLSVIFDFSSQTGGPLSIIENLIYGLLSNPITVIFVIVFWGALAYVLFITLKRVAHDMKFEKEFRSKAHIYFENIAASQNAAFSEFSNEPKETVYNPFELFEIKMDGDVAVAVEPPKKWEYAFVIAAYVMCFVSTVFTLIWGIFR